MSVSRRGQVGAGNAAIRSLSLPARQAAAPRVIAAEAPEVTMAASLLVIFANRAPAAVYNSLRSTKSREAAAMASVTSLESRVPPSEVTGPAALMSGRTPNIRS